MENFKTLNGKVIQNVIEYITNYILDRENVEILIGSDSQTYGSRKTVYGVVIALYTKGRGAHTLTKKDITPTEKNLQVRLMNEVWKSIEVAEYLKENGLPKPKWIDIDLNPDRKYKSNTVLRQAVGLVEGMGYKVRHKGSGAIITYSANNLVRI